MICEISFAILNDFKMVKYIYIYILRTWNHSEDVELLMRVIGGETQQACQESLLNVGRVYSTNHKLNPMVSNS